MLHSRALPTKPRIKIVKPWLITHKYIPQKVPHPQCHPPIQSSPMQISAATNTGCKKKYHSKKYLENILKIILFQYAYSIMKYGKNCFNFFHYIKRLNMV